MRQRTSFFLKDKRRKWIFGRLKNKRLPSITAPLPSKETTLSEAEEEQSKHALTVAIASAAAAEAAVTAAHAAVEVVRLTGVSQSTLICKEKSEESQPLKTSNAAPQFAHQCKRDIQESAAVIKIQTAFRGYLVSEFVQPVFFDLCHLKNSLHNLFSYKCLYRTLCKLDFNERHVNQVL